MISANNHPVPQVPVPTVRAIIIDHDARILLLQRNATAHALSQWCLPGGKIDYGQTAEQAIVREVLEETTLHVLQAEFFLFQDSLPGTPEGMHCINLYFACRVSGELRLNTESSAFAWIDRSKMEQYPIAFRNDEAMRLFWEKAQK